MIYTHLNSEPYDTVVDIDTEVVDTEVVDTEVVDKSVVNCDARNWCDCFMTCFCCIPAFLFSILGGRK